MPMEVADVREHKIAAEWTRISATAAQQINEARQQRRPIVAVGTTVTRALEATAQRGGGQVVANEAMVDLVIRPGFRFQVVDLLVTNFHLPRSSLLMLVCSFSGEQRTLAAYNEAVARGYRFYSYGDCMLTAQHTSRFAHGAQ